MERLDLTDAQYLTLAESGGRAAESPNTLFKVDSDGKTSAVMLECVQKEDGSTQTNTYNLEVQPREIYNLTKSWMYLRDCDFTCSTSDYIAGALKYQYTQPADSYNFNILANKKTGKVFFVPDQQSPYFYTTNNFDGEMSQFFAEDASGNLYSTTNPATGLSKISVTAEGAVITKLGPTTMSFRGIPYPLANGSVVTLDETDASTLNVVYPNGGYETFDGEQYGYYGARISHDKDNIFNLLTISASPTEEYNELKLRTVSVGNRYGAISVSEPLLSHGPVDNYIWWFSPVYMGDRYIIFGQLTAYDKQTGSWIDKDFLGQTLIIPTDANTYDNRSWNVYALDAAWMDLNTLETGLVTFDLPSYLQIDSAQPNIPNGETFVYVTDPSDGKSYVYRIDITTGTSTRSEISYSSSSIILIPLN